MHGVLRVFIVDDHPVVREGLRAMLAGNERIEVVGEAGSGEEAVERLGALNPDVLLTDIRMPGMSGIELARRAKALTPATAVIVLTMYDSSTYVVEALRAGAAGYLVKDCSRDLLCHAISAVVDGGTMVRSGLLRQAIDGVPRMAVANEQSTLQRLTSRERDVLRLVAEGRPNREIASQLYLAEVTVKKHVQAIIAKLGVSDRTQAAIIAVRQRMLE